MAEKQKHITPKGLYASVIHRVNLYPLDSAIGFPKTYQLDSDLSSG